MQTTEPSIKDLPSYDSFILDQGGSFLQCSSWGAWQQHNNRKPYRYTVAKGAGEVILAAQLLTYPLPLGHYYLYCPYGPVIRRGATGDERSLAIQELISKIKAEHPKAIFVKLEPVTELGLIKNALFRHQTASHIQPGSTLVLPLDLPEDELLGQMHKKTRYDIRIAIKHGVTVEKISSLTAADTEEALALVADTESRHGYKGHTPQYYKDIIAFFVRSTQSNCTIAIYTAKHEGRILSCGVFVDFGDTRTYLFGGSSLTNREVMPAYALHWHLIQDAKKSGLKKYDFWGIETSSGKTPGFVRFKLGFGGIRIQYPAPTNITWRDTSYALYTLAKKLRR